jgi:hypothetical protein
MTDDIISTPPQTTEAIAPNINVPTLPDKVKELVGEGKKYKTELDALASIPFAQEHIAKLEAEALVLREQAAKAKASEEIYTTMQELIAAQANPSTQSTLDEASIASLLDRKLVEREQRVVMQGNIAVVRDAAIAKWGDKAQEMYDNKAAELGISKQFLNSVVEKSPAAAMEILGLKPHTVVAPSTSRNTIPLPPATQTKPQKSIMGGATTEEVMSAWSSAKSKVASS